MTSKLKEQIAEWTRKYGSLLGDEYGSPTELENDALSIIRALEAKLENINNIIRKPYGTIEKIDPKEKTLSLTYEAWEALLKELDNE